LQMKAARLIEPCRFVMKRGRVWFSRPVVA